MKGLAKLAALFVGGLVLTALLANVLQQRAMEPVDGNYVPSSEATIDPHGWPAEQQSGDRQPTGRSRLLPAPTEG
jgi:hypothetical protein